MTPPFDGAGGRDEAPGVAVANKTQADSPRSHGGSGLRIGLADTEFHGYEAWKFTQNVIERMRLAGRVTAWLEQGKPAVLPEVQP